MKKVSKNGNSPHAGDKTFSSLADLTPDPRNARQHNPRNVGMLVDSLHQVGAARSIVVDENGVVLAGNATIEAAAEAGIHRVKTVEADGSEIVAVVRRGLSKEQKTKLALYDNRVAELAEWNPEVLAQLTETKEVEGMFSDKELAEILTQTGIEPKDAEPQIDKAEELRQKWGTETGQLWVIGNHRLLVGDATNKADVGRVCANVGMDAVVTDPPYGIGVDKSMHEKGGQQYGRAAAPKKHYAATDWDSAQPPDETIKWLVSCAPQVIIWGGNYFNLPPARCYLVWDKQNDGNQFADCELAWTNLDKPVRLIRHLWNGMLRAGKEERLSHPTQKPLEVIMWAINQLDGSPATILDTYCGVGTTVIAAENLGRQCLAMDIAPEYIACSLERITKAFPHLKIEKVDQARAAA